MISLSFTVYDKVATAVQAADIESLNISDIGILNPILQIAPTLLCMAGLAAMISKSGEITRRALGA